MAYDDDHIEFLTPAQVREPLPISIGLSGGSGSGKTYTALMLASGMADAMGGSENTPFALADTENRRGLHYRDQFPQILEHYIDFSPYSRTGKLVGYPPERWIDLYDAVEEAGVPVMVVDSFSHGWEGINGVLDQQVQILDRLVSEAQARNRGGQEVNPDRFNMLSWAEIKPKYRRLINRIIRSKVHTILCTRAKPVIQKMQKIDGKWVETNARKTKTRRADVPWDVAADGDLIFEMTAMAILDHEHPGCPRYQIKVADQFKRLFRADLPLTRDIGREMAEWSRGRGSALEEKAMLDAARTAARGGKDSLQKHWSALTQAQRDIVRTIMDDLKKTAIEADERAAQSDNLFAESGGETAATSQIDFDRIARAIRSEIDRADPAALDEVRKTYAEELAALREAKPKAHTELVERMAEREKAAA